MFAKLIKVIGKYKQKEVPFTAWILRVARNAALDHMRARRAIPSEEVRVTDTGQAHVGFDRGRDLRQALALLPEDHEALVLRHVVGLTPVEIADALGDRRAPCTAYTTAAAAACKTALPTSAPRRSSRSRPS